MHEQPYLLIKKYEEDEGATVTMRFLIYFLLSIKQLIYFWREFPISPTKLQHAILFEIYSQFIAHNSVFGCVIKSAYCFY